MMAKGLANGIKGKGKGKVACQRERCFTPEPTKNVGKVLDMPTAAEDTDGNEDYNTIKFDGIDSEEERKKALKKNSESQAFLEAMAELETLGMGDAVIPVTRKKPPNKKAKKVEDDSWGGYLFTSVFGDDQPKEVKRKSRVKSMPRSPKPSEDNIDVNPMAKSRTRSAPRLTKRTEDTSDLPSRNPSYMSNTPSNSPISPRMQHTPSNMSMHHSPRNISLSPSGVHVHGHQGKGKGKGNPAGQLRVQAHAREIPFGNKPSINKVNDISTFGHPKGSGVGNQIRQPAKLAVPQLGNDFGVRGSQDSSRQDHGIKVEDKKKAGLRKVRAITSVAVATKSTRNRIKLEEDDDDWNCEVEEEDDWGNYLYSSVVSVVYGQKMKKKAANGNGAAHAQSSSRSIAADPWATSSDDEPADKDEQRSSIDPKSQLSPACRVQLHQPVAQGKGDGKGRNSPRKIRPQIAEPSKHYF